jgi:hypothetical protein
LRLIGVIADEDFEQTGRTLDNLGLSGKGVDEIVELLKEGF